MATKNALFNYEQTFYLNGILLSGVTDINGSYSISQEPINIIGKGYVYPAKQGNMIGNFSIQKYYIGDEPLLDYIDKTPIKGSINYGNKSIGFDNGFLTEYSFSAGIGQIPQAQASINVYGDLGQGITAEGNNLNPDIQIPNQGSILINAKDYETNRVSRFQYTIRINRNPLYKIGSTSPVQVDIQYPIFQEANLTFDFNDYEFTKFRDFIKKPYQQDLNIVLNNPIDNSRIETFTIKNARIVNHSIQSSSTDLVTVNVTYNGYINKSDRQYLNPIIWDVSNIGTNQIYYVIEDELSDEPIAKSVVNNSAGGYIVNAESTISFDDGTSVEVPSALTFMTESQGIVGVTGFSYESPDYEEFIFKPLTDGPFQVIDFDTSDTSENINFNQVNNILTIDEINQYKNVVNMIKEPGIHKIKVLT